MAAYIKDDYHVVFADADRYMSDRLECYVSFLGTKAGYDASFQVNASQLGIASYTQYWHYRDGEYSIAKKTFGELKVVADEVVKEVEDNRIPFANIGPMTRAALKDIDLEHKESTGVQSYNVNLPLEQAADWRTTLYGNRYPGHTMTNQKGMVINSTQEVKNIKSEGSGRNKTYKLASEPETYIINHAKD